MSGMKLQYIKGYIKSNYRLVLLVCIVQIVLIQNVWVPGDLLSSNNNFNALFISICFMAFLTPLYQFRYVMKRSSSDLYFSLPIKRGDFYKLQCIIGAACIVSTTCISFFCKSLLANELASIPYNLLSICILEALGLSLYVFFSWIIVKCNSFLDSFLVSVAYTIVPIALVLIFIIFMERIMGRILVSETYFVMEEFQIKNLIYISGFLSTPWTMLILINNTMLFYSPLLKLLLLIYWLILGVIMYFLGKHAYIKRRGEQCEERTRTWISYPVIIPACTLLLLIICGISKDTIVGLILVFILFIVLHFLANRKVKITVYMIVSFICLVTIVYGIEEVLVENNVFGRIKEVYMEDEIKDMRVEIFINEIQTSEYVNSMEWNTLSDSKKQEIFDFQQDVLEHVDSFQQDVLEHVDDIMNSEERSYMWINIHQKLNKGGTRYRSYRIQNMEGFNFINTEILRLKDKGILFTNNAYE